MSLYHLVTTSNGYNVLGIQMANFGIALVGVVEMKRVYIIVSSLIHSKDFRLKLSLQTDLIIEGRPYLKQ